MDNEKTGQNVNPENTESTSGGRFNAFIAIPVTQAIFVTVIILTVLAVKLFLPATFSELEKWYNENITVGTDIGEVLEPKAVTELED